MNNQQSRIGIQENDDEEVIPPKKGKEVQEKQEETRLGAKLVSSLLGGEVGSDGAEGDETHRNERKRKSNLIRKGAAAVSRRQLPNSKGRGYYLFQCGQGRTLHPYCWYRA